MYVKCLIILSLCLTANAGFTDISGSLLKKLDDGVLAAFADFTSDKNADMMVITNNGTKVVLVAGQKEGSYYNTVFIEDDKGTEGTIITSVMPSDFDGDGRTDILVTRQFPGSKPGHVIVDVYWHAANKYKVDGRYRLSDELKDQPLLLDFNADGVTDLFAEDSTGKRHAWIGNKGWRNFTKVRFPDTPSTPFASPSCNAFIDLNGDLVADLMVTVKDKITQRTHFEYWYNERGNFVHDKDVSPPVDKISVFGQSTFIDMNGDGLMDHILPVCMDSQCAISRIYVYSKNNWTLVMTSTEGYSFALPRDNVPESQQVPITLRLADFNLDGYPDILAVLKTENKAKEIHRKAFILANAPCNVKGCSDVGRMFRVTNNPVLESVDNVDVAAFFDIYENGIIDIFVHTGTVKEPGPIHAFYHSFSSDGYFVKVTVVSGLCSSQCPDGHQPYGTNAVGPTIDYMIYDSEGNPLKGVEGQLSQSSHFSLQMPYTIFGLGLTPNYVESLSVGIPTPPPAKVSDEKNKDPDVKLRTKKKKVPTATLR